MAINSEKVAKVMTGLPTKEQMVMGQDGDNLNAAIVNPETGDSSPAELREGEYVFDIPSIVGLGDGDYETGLAKLQEIHQTLRSKGLGIMEEQGLGGVK